MQKDVFVGRQPILDRRGLVVAQELLFRDGSSGRAQVRDGFACTAAVVERVCGTLGIEGMLGDTDGYLNCTGAFLSSELVNLLPASRFVLEILEDVQLDDELAKRCDVLRRAGFRVALDDVRTMTPAIVDFLPHVDIVKLDWPFIAPHEVGAIVAQVKAAGRIALAEKVEYRDDHAAAMACHCDLFQGYYFAKPQVVAAKKPASSYGEVMRVLQLLMDDANDTLLEAALKRAPSLVVQLLRLANNSDRHQVRDTRIMSIRQALASVGCRQLMRWCCMLVYCDSDQVSPESDPLMRMVEHRAGFLEHAARELRPHDDAFCQSAYLAGMLSLVHVPHGVDVATFVSALPVGTAIQSAIIGHEGAIGGLLSIAEDLEEGRFVRALERGDQFGDNFAATLPALTF
jgi:c-di-GMP-related signal transduction protein